MPHEFIHIPSVSIGPCFETFDVNPLPFVHMLRSFRLLLSTDTIPPCSFNSTTVQQFLQSNGPAYALTQYTQFFPLVLVTGASISITPVLSDFKNGLQPSPVSFIHALQSTSPVMGAGTVQWKTTDITGKPQTIRTYALYIPNAHARLFSPQHFCRASRDGKVVLDHATSNFQCRHDTAPIEFPYHIDNVLPIISQDLKPKHSFLASIFPLSANNATVMHSDNTNLSVAQKELLHWHHRLGHVNMRWIQQLLRSRNWVGSRYNEFGNEGNAISSFFPSVNPKVTSCPTPLCAACVLAKSSRKSSRVRVTSANTSVPGLKINHLFPGQVVSVDQYASTVRGHLPHTQGRELESEQF